MFTAKITILAQGAYVSINDGYRTLDRLLPAGMSVRNALQKLAEEDESEAARLTQRAQMTRRAALTFERDPIRSPKADATN